MNLFDFFSFSSLAHSEIAENGADKVLSSGKENSSVHKTYVNFPTSRKSALDVPLYAISFLFSFFCRGLQMYCNFLTTCTTLGTRGKKLQADAALCGRIAKNGADAKPCLSDVYKSGTRARRRQVDAALCGRSMVEMLGVLAIIGVLSVGAISGYSKAMLKYKLNKQAEAMNLLLNNAMQLRPPMPDEGSVFYSELLSKLNLLPDGIRLWTDKKFLIDSFGNTIWFFAGTKLYGIGYHFDNDGSNRLAICSNLLNVYKENHASLYQIISDTYFGNTTDDITIDYYGTYYGDGYCSGNAKCITDITLTDIETLCQSCNQDSNACRLYVTWK